MSQYLKFILRRAGAPTPKSIAVLKHKDEWVNHQIVDEFKIIFPSVSIAVLDKIGKGCGELVVLPFIGEFLNTVPGGIGFYRDLGRERDKWVMLYRLDYRRIEVLRARDLGKYYWQRRVLRLCEQAVTHFRLRTLVRSLIRIWKRVS
jgi:hypothetical protein